MASNFDVFSEIPNVDMESADRVKDKPEVSKKVLKRLKKLIKELHKQNKLFRQLCRRSELTVAKEPATEEPVVEEASTASKKNCHTNTTAPKTEKSFLGKLGDAFLKAFPSILRTIATVAVPLFFSCFSRRFGNVRKVVT